MPNPISLQAVLSVQGSDLSVQGSGNKTVTPTGSKTAVKQVTAPTSWGSPIDLIDGSTNAGYLFVRNTHGTLDVQLSLATAGGQIFAKLRAGQFCLVPLKDSTPQIWALASGSGVTIELVAAEA